MYMTHNYLFPWLVYLFLENRNSHLPNIILTLELDSNNLLFLDAVITQCLDGRLGQSVYSMNQLDLVSSRKTAKVDDYKCVAFLPYSRGVTICSCKVLLQRNAKTIFNTPTKITLILLSPKDQFNCLFLSRSLNRENVLFHKNSYV